MPKIKPLRVKAKTARTTPDARRLLGQSEKLRSLTAAAAMKTLSPRRQDKLLRQLKKIDRSIEKITKIVS